ncbi:hypothetical protein [Pedobacter sp. Leaf170]|uniref:hypothetical protein n=1 Tax=Pedobacter sp. Leaf170 TaxID=2876558 RepID=UPI001E4E14B7|nr:hypothetical protein [Pedobacter sp. Leaf170]
MIGLTNYLNYAKEHNIVLHRYEGIIIWNTSFGPLPQEVLFLPVEWDGSSNFENFVEQEFSKEDAAIYQVYFQGMRWIMPSLADSLNNARYINVGVGTNYNLSRASYVAITFVTDANNDEFTLTERIRTLPVMVTDKRLTVKLHDDSPRFGTAKLFETINW